MRYLFALVAIVSFSLAAKSNTKNYFNSKSDSIDFGSNSVAPFKYEASSVGDKEKGGENLFDSNINSYWYSENTSLDEWVIIDFGSKRLVNGFEIEIPTFKKRRAIPSYQIQVLHRDNWMTIFENKKPEFKNKNFIGNIDASIFRVLFPKKENRTYIAGNLRFTLNGKNLTGVDERLTGHTLPIKTVVFPEDESLLPGAPRKYRNGIHKGLDFFHKKNSDGDIESVTSTDSIVATQSGIIIRSDNNYKPMTKAEYDEITSYNQTHPVTYVNRDFGGRQIWIDHENGVMTCYNHLSSINPSIKPGYRVKKGEVIGKVGNSGLLGDALGNSERIHLHFEVWVDGEFVGKGLKAGELRKMFQFFFTE